MALYHPQINHHEYPNRSVGIFMGKYSMVAFGAGTTHHAPRTMYHVTRLVIHGKIRYDLGVKSSKHTDEVRGNGHVK